MTGTDETSPDCTQNGPETASKRRLPAGLRAPGKALWADITSGYQLRPDEYRVLVDACRLADAIGALERAMKGQELTTKGSHGQPVLNPLQAEQRTHRLALARLLHQLKLPDDAGHKVNQQRTAAQSRWANAHGGGKGA